MYQKFMYPNWEKENSCQDAAYGSKYVNKIGYKR